jgi:hypothetical protein
MVAMKVINASRSAFRESGEHEISLDPVIETTYRTGLDMQSRHKETFLGDSQQHRALILGRDRARPGIRDIRPHWHRWPQCSATVTLWIRQLFRGRREGQNSTILHSLQVSTGSPYAEFSLGRVA